MKHYLSFHTVFVLNENIKWLEEFIIYYKNIGFDHFYLYHNEGSIGRNKSTMTSNKYGFPIKGISGEDDTVELQRILSKYGSYITYTLWQPKVKGNIVYGYNESVYDCIKKYGSDNEWIAFLDLDEFIYSVNNINIPDYLRSLDAKVSSVMIYQKKFLDRFLTDKKLITQEYRCINNLDTSKWAPKHIARCKDIISIIDMHSIRVKNQIIKPDMNMIRFNHYNLNDYVLKYMKGIYKTNTDFKIDNEDPGMSRYKDNILTEMQ
jgi:hypothetical protein